METKRQALFTNHPPPPQSRVVKLLVQQLQLKLQDTVFNGLIGWLNFGATLPAMKALHVFYGLVAIAISGMNYVMCVDHRPMTQMRANARYVFTVQ